MSDTDYYSILGVQKSSSLEDIKKAYRTLAKKHHPDKCKAEKDKESAKIKFQAIQHAYDILSDPQKRADYDSMGHHRYNQSQTSGGGEGFRQGDFSGFGDIFSEIFSQFGDFQFQSSSGFGFQRDMPRRGQDLKYKVELNLKDAFFGIKLKAQIPRTIPCAGCGGNGVDSKSTPTKCSACNGKGSTRSRGFFMNEVCGACRGKGMKQDACKACNGKCSIYSKSDIDLNIPQGVYNGLVLQMQGQGDAGLYGGPSGDLYVHIQVAGHELFEVDGVNLICEIPINIIDMVLGCEVEVPIINQSTKKITVPACSGGDKKIKIPGAGMPVLGRKSFGDMYVKLKIEVPTSLQANEKDLWEKLREMRMNSKNEESFFQKVKNFLFKK